MRQGRRHGQDAPAAPTADREAHRPPIGRRAQLRGIGRPHGPGDPFV